MLSIFILKFIYIINHKRSFLNVINELPVRFFEAILIWRLYGFKLAAKYMSTLDLIKLNKLKKHKNVILVINNFNNDTSCTDRKKLIELFNYGKEQGKKVAAYL